MMNLSSWSVKHIPTKEEIAYSGSCRFAFNGECQLLNCSCSGKNKKNLVCNYFEPEKRINLTF